MAIYDFTVVLNEEHALTEDLETRVYEAGCDDALLGVGVLDFCREAESLVDAVASAIRDVRKAGLSVRSITVDDAAVGVAYEFVQRVPDRAERERLLETLAAVTG